MKSVFFRVWVLEKVKAAWFEQKGFPLSRVFPASMK